MASLDEILKKTKAKSEKVKTTRERPSIATRDRPYSATENNAEIESNLIQHKVDTNQTQTEHKQHTKLTQTPISELVGVQKKILLFLYKECSEQDVQSTRQLTIAHIADTLSIASGSIKTSIARLCKKGMLEIIKFKNGRGGWSVYKIPSDVYSELLILETQHKLNTN